MWKSETRLLEQVLIGAAPLTRSKIKKLGWSFYSSAYPAIYGGWKMAQRDDVWSLIAVFIISISIRCLFIGYHLDKKIDELNKAE